MQYVINRLKEPSTWRGLIMIAVSAFGLHWSPESQESIVYAGIGLAGLLGTVLPDSWKK